MAMGRVTEQGPAKKLWAGSLGQVYSLSGSWSSWCCKKIIEKNILYDMVMFFLMKFQTDLVSERLWNSWIFLHFQKSNGCFRCADDCMIHGEVKDGGLRRMAKEQGRMPFKSPWRDEQIEVGRLDSFFIGICEETDGFQPLGHTLYHTQNYSILIWCKL